MVAKVNSIDTGGFVLTTKYQTDKTELEKKIPDVTDFVKKAKLIELENKISDISNLASKTALTTVEIKYLMLVVLLKKQSHFEEDGIQNYLLLQSLNKNFKVITNTDYLSSWKSKGLSAETIKPPTTSDTSLTPIVSYYGTKTRVKFTGSCLKQPKISYTHRKVVNIYIVYELVASSSHNNDLTLKNCFFGAVTLTKNADTDKYGYSGYGIGLDRRSIFSFPNWKWSKCINFWSKYEFFCSY